MLVMTAKLDKKRIVVVILVLIAVAVALVLLLGSGKEAQATAAPSLSANEGRVAYLKERGWEVAATPVESGQVRLPKEADPVYDRYLALQKSQGFDLASYAGKTVMRYVYQVTNYPGGGTEPVYATLLIYKNQVIGGDVTDSAPGGQIRALKMPEAPPKASVPVPSTVTPETTPSLAAK